MTIAEYRAKNKKKTIADYKASQRKLASTPFAKRESMGLSAAIDRDAAQTANEALRQRMIEREAERLAKIETEKIAQAAVIAKQKLSQEDEMRKAALPTGIRFEPERVTSDRIPKISDINRSAANVDYSREIQDVESRFPKTPLTFAEKAQKYNPLAVADMMINKAGAGVVQSGAAIADSVAASVKAREDSAFTQYINNARNVFQSMRNKAYPSSQANAPQNWDVDKKVDYYRGDTLQEKSDRYSADIDKRYIGLTDTFITKGLSDLAQSTGYMIPSTVTNAILPGAGTALLFASGYAQGERQAIQAGSDPEDARRYALLNGLNQSAGELLIGGVLGKGAGLLDSAFRKAGLDIVSSIKNPVLRRAVGAAMRIGGESAEEAVQNVLDTLAQKATYNTDAKFDPKAIAYDALLGGAMSALFGLAGNVKTLALPSVKEAVLPSIAPVTTSRASIDSEDYFKQKTSAINGKVNELSGRLRTQDEEVLYNRLVSAKSDTEKSGILAGASDTDIKLISDTAKKLGKDILFYSEGRTESGNIRNGYEYGGRLYINAKAAASSQWVAAHELTHSIENTATYAKLNKYLMGRMTESEVNAKRADMARIRTAEGANLTAEEIDQEIVADYVANNLLRNESDILNLVKADMTLGEKIRDWIDTVIKKVTGTDAEAFYVTAKAMYTKALAEAKRVSGMREATAKASVSEDVKSDNFKQWFGDWENSPDTASKAVDKSGKPMVLYHQTANDFTVFDTTAKGAGTSDYETPYGIFLKSSSNDIGLKGKKQMPVYANIRNPLVVADRAELNQKLSDLSPELKAFFDKVKGNDDLYRQKWRKSKDTEHDYIRNWREKNPDGDLINDQGIKDLFDSTSNLLTEWTESNKSLNGKSKDIVTQTLKDAGYDGVRIAQDKGSFGRATDTYIALNPTQIKSATANIGTYDTNNPDIRYSISQSQEDALTSRKVTGDAHDNAIDLAEQIESVKGEITADAKAVLYHATTQANADKISRTGKMYGKEDNLFFSTKKDGQIQGYGDAVVRVELPLEKLELNDQFDDELHLTMAVTPNKYTNIRYSISKADDTAYMDAVERGDTDTAQKMVDEAAKKAGYNVKAYHGTKNTFTVFSEALRGTNQTTEAGKKYFFAGDRETAESYSPYHVLKNLAETMPKIFRMKDADAAKGKGGVLDLYISMKNPLEADLIDYDWSAHFEKADALMEYIEQAETNGNDGLIFHHVPDNLMKPGKRISTIYLFKNASQAKSADPITYDDSGNVIPLSKRFDSAKSDIRYSISEDEAAAPRTTAELESENKQLRELNEYQRKQMNRTSTVEPNIYAVTAYVKKIRKAYSSKTPVKQLTDKLSALYTFASNSESGDADWGDMYDYARNIADDILAGSSVVVNQENYLKYKKVKSEITGKVLRLTDKSKADIPDYAAFAKKVSKYLQFSAEEGTSADAVYSALTEKIGSDLFPPEIISTAEQIQHIAEVMEKLSDVFDNPYKGTERQNAGAFIAHDILNDLYSIPADKQTFDILVKTSQKLQRLKENADRTISGLKAAAQKKAARAKLNASKTDLRRHIRNACVKMASALSSPDKNKHIPDELLSSVAELFRMIDFAPSDVNKGGKEAGKIKDDALKNRIEEIATYYTNAISIDKEVGVIETADPSLLLLLREVRQTLSHKSIRAMNEEELRDLSDLTSAIYSAITNANKTFIRGKQNSIDEIAESVRTDNKEKGSRNDPVKWLPKVADKLINFFTLDPRLVFKRMGATMENLYMNIERGQDKYIETVTQTVEFMRETLKDIDTAKWDGPGADLITVGIYGDYLKSTVHEVKMTPAMIMELYLLNQREQGRKHIYGQAGISLMMPGADKAQKPVIVTEEDVDGIIAKMTPEMKRVADAMGKYVSENMAVLGNEVSLAMYGYSKFTDPHYWQIHVDKGGIPTAYGDTQGDPKLANNGFTKTTKEGAKNAIVIGSALNTFDRHTVQMAAYNAYVLPLSDIERVLNNNDEFGMNVGSMLSDKHGAEAKRYIENFIRLVNGGQLSNSLWNNDFGSKGLRNFKSAAVGFNLAVVAKQPVSYIRAVNEINPKYLLEAFKPESAAARKKNTEEMLKYNPVARIKDWGYADMGFGKNQRQLYDDSSMTASDKIAEASGHLPSQADKITWARLWSAVKLEQHAKGIYDMATIAERFKQVISNTQVVNTIFTTPAILNEKDLFTKSLTAFTAEPLKAFNMLHDAIESKNPRKIARAASALIANQFVISLITVAFSRFRRKDDEDENTAEQVALDMLTSAAGMLPYMRDIVSLIQGYDIKRTDMAGVAKVVNAIRGAASDIARAGEGADTSGTALYHTKALTSALGDMLGIPITSVTRDIEAVVRTFAESTGNADMELLISSAMYNPSYDSNKKIYYDMLSRYADDDEKFDKLKGILIADYGFTEDGIESGIRNRLRKTDEYKAEYEPLMAKVSGNIQNDYFLKLPETEQRKVMMDANTYVGAVAMAATDPSYKMSIWAQNVSDAVSDGLTAGEYLLFGAAKRKADADKNGSYSNIEKISALRDLDWMGETKQAALFRSMTEKEGESKAADGMEAITDAGVSFDEFLNIYQQYSEIGADNTLKASERALKFANWLDERYTPEQSDIAQEHFGYWSGAKANPSNYNKFADAGIEYDTAYEIAADLMALSPLEGKKSVSNAQQYRLIADSDYDDKIKIQAMSVLMEESAYTNFRKATLKGVSIKKYVDFVENSARIESDKEDGKPVLDSKKQKVLTLIDKMVLTTKGKDALYYAAGYKESTIDEAPWYSGERYDGDIYQQKSNGIVIRKLPKKS